MNTESNERVKLFLSHKDDDKEAAGKVQRTLMKYFDVDVFLSSDTKSIRGGKEWRREIQNAVLNSDRFILLFTDVRLNWDWCLFEAGLFRGSHPENDNHEDSQVDVVVLVPCGMPPAPLNHLQSVPAHPGKVEEWLRTLPAKTDNDGEVTKAAGKIVEFVQKLAVHYFNPQNLMEVCVPVLVNRDRKCECDVNLATVRFSNGGGTLFGKGDNTPFDWPDVAEAFSSCNFDVEGLWLMAQNVRSDRGITQPSLDLFLPVNNKIGYRPVVIDAELREGNKVGLEFCLVQIPPTFDTEQSHSIDILYQVVHLCCRFRWEVVQENAESIRQALVNNQVNRQLLTATNRKIQSILRDAKNRRITETRVNGAVGVEAREAIKDIQKKWEQSYKLFKEECEGAGNIQSAHDLLIVMRHLNHAYLTIALAELGRFVAMQDLPDVDDLDIQLANLLPVPSDYWRTVSVEQSPVVEEVAKKVAR